MSVRPTTPQERAWTELAAELTPARSLLRLDAATARVVTSITILGSLLTGLGLLVAASPVAATARVSAIVAVITGSLAIVLALAAQVLTITRGLNTSNLVEVRSWYRWRIAVRGPLAQAGTALLVLAAIAAGLSGTLQAIGGDLDQPTLAVTRTSSTTSRSDTVIVDVTFHGLDPGQVGTVSVAAGNRITASAVVSAGPDGSAARTLTVEDVPATATVAVAATGRRSCSVAMAPGEAISEPICGSN